MKTQKHSNPTLPSPVKFSIYLIAVAVLCLLNWNALKASDPVSDEIEGLETRLDAALVPVAEAEIELEDWMLKVSDQDLVVLEEENFVDEELEIVLQGWMINRFDAVLAEVADPPPAIEDWMVNTDSWFKVEFVATK